MATERDCLAPWCVLVARRLQPLARCLPHNAAVGVRCRVCLARWSKTSPQKAWLCTIANREYPSLPLLLLWLTIDRVACGQVCFGGGHFELVPAGRMCACGQVCFGVGHVELVPAGRVGSQCANPLCLEGSLRPHGDLVSAGRIESRYANHLRCLGGQLPSSGARSGALLDNAPATVSLRQTGAAAA